MKCPNCGNEIEENKNFCTNCGTKLDMNNIQNISNKRIHLSLKRIIIIVSIILFTICIIAIIVQLSIGSKPAVENANIAEEQQIYICTPNQAGIFRNEANVIEEKFDKNNNMTYYKTKNDNGTFNEETFTYQYDDKNRLTRMANSKDEYITITYNDNNQISSTTNSNGAMTKYYYKNNELLYKVTTVYDITTIDCYKTYTDNGNDYILELGFSNQWSNAGFMSTGYNIYRKTDLNTSDFSNAFQLLQLEIMFDTNYVLGYDNPYSLNANLFPYAYVLGYKTTLKSFSVNYNIFDNLSTETSKTEKYFDKEYRILKEEKTDDNPEYYQYERINDNEILQKYLFETVDIDTGNPEYCEYKIKYYYENNKIVKKEFISMNENLTKTEYEELEKDYIKYFNENVDTIDYGDIEGYSNEILSYDKIINLYVDNKENEINDTNSIENNATNNSNSSQQTPINSNNSSQINSSNTPTYNDTSTTTPQPNTNTNQQSQTNNNANSDIIDEPTTPKITVVNHVMYKENSDEPYALIYVWAEDKGGSLGLKLTINGKEEQLGAGGGYNTGILKKGKNDFYIVVTNKYGNTDTQTYTIEI